MRKKKKFLAIVITIFLFVLIFGVVVYNQTYKDRTHVDTLIVNGQILTINNKMEIIEDGVIAIEGNEIKDVGPSNIANNYFADNTIDAKDGIVMPGMVNCHEHIPMIAFRGIGEEGIEDRLQSYFFPLEAEMLSRDLINKATTHGCIEMALGGVTTYADMYYHMDEMAEATKEIGLRAVLGEAVSKYSVVDASTPYGGLDYAVNFIENYKDDELIDPALGPHATYSVSDEKLMEVKALAQKTDSQIMIHVCEFDNEDKRLNLDEGTSVVKHLEDIGFLDDNVMFAHSIHVSDEDLDIMKKHNISVSYNPMANAKGATGIAPAWDMINKGIRVGIGTDGPMSSNEVDIFRTMSYAANMQRIKYNDRTIMTPDIVVKMATLGGAEALGKENEIGSLEAGKLADIVIMENSSPNMIPNYNPYATLVFSASGNNVKDVFVNGKMIVEDKKLLTYSTDHDEQNMKEIEQNVAEFGKELAEIAKSKN